MKYKLMLLVLLGGVVTANAQLGYPHTKKEDIEKFKDKRLIVVQYSDSTYNASIKEAVEKYWTFNSGFEFVNDTMMKAYNKPDYAYLMFAKSKKSSKTK